MAEIKQANTIQLSNNFHAGLNLLASISLFSTCMHLWPLATPLLIIQHTVIMLLFNLVSALRNPSGSHNSYNMLSYANILIKSTTFHE